MRWFLVYVVVFAGLVWVGWQHLDLHWFWLFASVASLAGAIVHALAALAQRRSYADESIVGVLWFLLILPFCVGLLAVGLRWYLAIPAGLVAGAVAGGFLSWVVAPLAWREFSTPKQMPQKEESPISSEADSPITFDYPGICNMCLTTCYGGFVDKSDVRWLARARWSRRLRAARLSQGMSELDADDSGAFLCEECATEFVSG